MLQAQRTTLGDTSSVKIKVLHDTLRRYHFHHHYVCGIRHASGRADDETTRQSTICLVLSLMGWNGIVLSLMGWNGNSSAALTQAIRFFLRASDGSFSMLTDSNYLISSSCNDHPLGTLGSGRSRTESDKMPSSLRRQYTKAQIIPTKNTTPPITPPMIAPIFFFPSSIFYVLRCCLLLRGVIVGDTVEVLFLWREHCCCKLLLS